MRLFTLSILTSVHGTFAPAAPEVVSTMISLEAAVMVWTLELLFVGGTTPELLFVSGTMAVDCPGPDLVPAAPQDVRPRRATEMKATAAAHLVARTGLMHHGNSENLLKLVDICKDHFFPPLDCTLMVPPRGPTL
jgi:hypothetical protein